MSGFGGTNPFSQLKDMLADASPVIATVSATHSDGTVTVTNRGGSQQRVRASMYLASGDNVLVRGGEVSGTVPAMSSSSISIG